MAEDPRIVELELRYAELQDYVEQLDGVVLAQQRELDALRAEVEALRRALERLAAREER